MHDLDDLERRVLERARQDLEPTPGDESRLWAALSLELGAVGVMAPFGGSGGTALGASQAGKALGAAALKWSTLAGGAALIGAAGFGSGYFVGRTSGHDEARAAARAHGAAVPTPVSTAVTSTTDIRPAPASAERAETQRPTPVAEDRAAARAGLAAREHPEPSAVDEAFYDELSLLQRAERAIRSNNPLLALSLLGDLDHQFPRGKLLEERTAARVMAGCQNSLDPASQGAARRFVSSHPQSVYAARVQSLCELAPTAAKDSSPSGH
jgi:hypothetical protein